LAPIASGTSFFIYNLRISTKGSQSKAAPLTIHSSRTRFVASRLRPDSRAGRLNSGVSTHMQSVAENRRRKLAEIVAEAGSQSSVAIAIGKDRNQIHQWLLEPTQPGARNIGSASARQIESCYGKPAGWLDQGESDITESRIASALFWLEADARDAFLRLSPERKAKIIMHLCSKNSRPSGTDLLALLELVS
jgi:hypothetical protein